MDVAYDSLRELPEGAVFTAREGRATATLQKEGNRIVVYATCDSLAREVACYEEEIARLRMMDEQRSDSVRAEKETARGSGGGWRWWWVGLLTGLAVGCILTLMVTRKF